MLKSEGILSFYYGTHLHSTLAGNPAIQMADLHCHWSVDDNLPNPLRFL